MKKGQEILFISNSPQNEKSPFPKPGKKKHRPPERPQPSPTGLPSSGPTPVLATAPIIPLPPPPAQAQWEPGPIRAPERRDHGGARPGQRRLRAGQAFGSRSRGLSAFSSALYPSLRPAPLPPFSPVLQIHLQDLAVALKEALHIALPGLVAQATDVYARHPGNGGGG